MTETQVAGWGVPGFLPPNVRRRMLRDDAREAREAKQAEAAREAQAEELHQRAMRLYAEQAELRGEVVTAMQLASGQVPGRPVAAILEAARQAGDRDDAITAARLHRQGHGEPERVNIEVAEPVLLAPAARSAAGWKIFNRARHFRDLLEARRQLEAAEKAAAGSRNDYGFV